MHKSTDSDEFTEREVNGYPKRPQTFATAAGVVAVLLRLKGPKVAAFREEGAEAFIRALGGDDGLVREVEGGEEDDLANAMGALEIDDRRTALMERRFRLYENARRVVATWHDCPVQETICNLIERQVVTLFEEALPSTAGVNRGIAAPNPPTIAVPPAPAAENA